MRGKRRVRGRTGWRLLMGPTRRLVSRTRCSVRICWHPPSVHTRGSLRYAIAILNGSEDQARQAAAAIDEITDQRYRP